MRSVCLANWSKWDVEHCVGHDPQSWAVTWKWEMLAPRYEI